MARVIKLPNGCWQWTGYTDKGGYGTVRMRGSWRAHRASYFLHKGSIPDGLNVRHTCQYKACVNPEHLELEPQLTPLESLMSKVIILPSGCWQWTGSLNNKGYGRVSVNGRRRLAHRVSYEIHNGSIPETLEIDHICHDPKICLLGDKCPHRGCVNPNHLILSTHARNCSAERATGLGAVAANAASRARTHCKRGHEFTADNTRIKGTARNCKECSRISEKADWLAEKFGYSSRRRQEDSKGLLISLSI